MTSLCTDDSCDEVNDVIVNAVNDANCDNNLFCDGSETCHATLDCQDGAPIRWRVMTVIVHRRQLR